MAYSRIVAGLREQYNHGNGVLKTIAARQTQLDNLARFISEKREDIITALKQDLGKPRLEAISNEIGLVEIAIQSTLRKLPGWHKSTHLPFIPALPGTATIMGDPLGVVLILSPWNYPFQLSMLPLIGALAAGNCVVLKPSEINTALTKLLATQLPEYINPACLQVVEGGPAEIQDLLKEKFDKIFFTGGGSIAESLVKTVVKDHPLTPFLLELGGKSPCIVDRSADFAAAAKSILRGKLTNAGQICIAPDYVLVHPDDKPKLVSEMQQALKAFYGDDIAASNSFGRIVNDRHYQRLLNLINSVEEKAILVTGQHDPSTHFIAPTIVNAKPDDLIMQPQQEIFGPILPLVEIESIEAAINFVNERPRPLAAYLFAQDKKVKDQVEECLRAGNMAINATLIQGAIPTLPFGGVGESGYGVYHGIHSFEAFSHPKGIYDASTKIDIAGRLTTPPYTAFKEKALELTFFGLSAKDKAIRGICAAASTVKEVLTSTCRRK